jgi:hypothetical protein
MPTTVAVRLYKLATKSFSRKVHSGWPVAEGEGEATYEWRWSLPLLVVLVTAAAAVVAGIEVVGGAKWDKTSRCHQQQRPRPRTSHDVPPSQVHSSCPLSTMYSDGVVTSVPSATSSSPRCSRTSDTSKHRAATWSGFKKLNVFFRVAKATARRFSRLCWLGGRWEEHGDHIED